MKTLITAIVLALTTTTAVAHQPETTNDTEFKRGFCHGLMFNVDNEEIVTNTEILAMNDINDFLQIKTNRVYLNGKDEAKGLIAFGKPTRAHIVECQELFDKLGKAKWELHNK